MEKFIIINADIQDQFICPNCRLIIDNPFEVECCGTLFCANCINTANIRCQKCNRKAKYRQNSFAKRLFNQMKFTCGFNCGQTFNSGEIREHMVHCEQREFICNFCAITEGNLIFTGRKKEFIAHIVENHESMLINFNDSYGKMNMNMEHNNLLEDQNEEKTLAMHLKYTRPRRTGIQRSGSLEEDMDIYDPVHYKI